MGQKHPKISKNCQKTKKSEYYTKSKKTQKNPKKSKKIRKIWKIPKKSENFFFEIFFFKKNFFFENFFSHLWNFSDFLDFFGFFFWFFWVFLVFVYYWVFLVFWDSTALFQYFFGFFGTVQHFCMIFAKKHEKCCTVLQKPKKYWKSVVLSQKSSKNQIFYQLWATSPGSSPDQP